jgi:hypothetical protein
MTIVNTPVLLLLFNRPGCTKVLLNKIASLSLNNLYIVVDGPRKGNVDDNINCKIVQELVESTAFNSNQVFKKIRTENLGCRHGVKDAIDWFFSEETEGIILEDDCIPDDTFFTFCEKLLERYKETENVLAISGDNFLLGQLQTHDSYYFTKYFHAWGWATWKRAWEKYDFNMDGFPSFVERNMLSYYKVSDEEKQCLENLYTSVYNDPNRQNSWAYPFSFTVLNNHAFCIAPAKNLVNNIGFSIDATHTRNRPYWYQYVKTESLRVTKHPDSVILNTHADAIEFNTVVKHMYAPSIVQRVKSTLKKIF